MLYVIKAIKMRFVMPMHDDKPGIVSMNVPMANHT